MSHRHATATGGNRPARLIAIGILVIAAIISAGCGSSNRAVAKTSRTPTTSIADPRPQSLPDTPAGRQTRWLLAASADLPIPNAELRAHFDRAFLAQISPPNLNRALEAAGRVLPGSGPVRLDSIDVDQARLLVVTLFRAGGPPRLSASLGVDRRGLISGLLFKPLTPAAPTSWPTIDAAVSSVAPNVAMLVANITRGRCQAIHAINPGIRAPIASVFKLYVLDAVGNEIASGRLRWNQPLTITARLKSLPSGLAADRARRNQGHGPRRGGQADLDQR